MGLVICFYCRKQFIKDTRHINENRKLNHKFYCSPHCLSSSRNKKILLSCNYCGNYLLRAPHAISPHNFCNNSCSAKYTNSKRLYKKNLNKRTYIRKSKAKLTAEQLREIKRISGKKAWENYVSPYTKDFVIVTIQKFVQDYNRIPVKRELNKFYHPARRFFGTWNNAIVAAGFKPNPVLFAEHHIAKDGHNCDSIAEMLIDDYLYEHNIPHLRRVPYPEGLYTTDFKVADCFIEFFGLAGEHKRYDELRSIKQQLNRKYSLNLIEIYPTDLYPVSKLDHLFAKFKASGLFS